MTVTVSESAASACVAPSVVVGVGVVGLTGCAARVTMADVVVEVVFVMVT